MAEFIFKDIVKKERIENSFYISSAATSREEIGNPVYYAAKEKLNELGINCSGKYAVQAVKKDYEKYDYLLVMEEKNLKNLIKITGTDKDKKIFKLLDFVGGGDISDPWYTRNFDAACEDIKKGCYGFLDYLKENCKI